MGRVGACADNAAMESFFSLQQKNVLNRQRWDTRENLRLAIVIWIERTYHRRRRQEGLGRLTPVEFEMSHTTTPQTARAALSPSVNRTLGRPSCRSLAIADPRDLAAFDGTVRPSRTRVLSVPTGTPTMSATAG